MFYYDTSLEFDCAYLLSKTEAGYYLNQDERKYAGGGWWTRSTGDFGNSVCYVGGSGYIHTNGIYVGYDFFIRPVLHITSLGGFRVGNVFTIDKWEFKIISPNLAWLYKQDYGEYRFGDTCDYLKSAVKKRVDEWYNKLQSYMKEDVYAVL